MKTIEALAYCIVGAFVATTKITIDAWVFWIIWTHYGLGKVYAYWLPPIFQSIPFWHCVGLFMAISIVKSILMPSSASGSKSEDQSKEK